MPCPINFGFVLRTSGTHAWEPLNLFSLFWLHWVSVEVCEILPCGSWASLLVAHGLSCPMACAILVPWPGIKPTFPALNGELLTTGPPGKSQTWLLLLLLELPPWNTQEPSAAWVLYCLACVLSCYSHVWLFVTLWAGACQFPLSMGLSRQEYWSGLPCPPPGDLPHPGIKPVSLLSPALADGFFTTTLVPAGKPFTALSGVEIWIPIA